MDDQNDDGRARRSAEPSRQNSPIPPIDLDHAGTSLSDLSANAEMDIKREKSSTNQAEI
ncbi:MAG: hypothetical protein JNL83_17525 [Myxococcales bacterium]|nr:hypothetical protein [Myxococcales bacterium]